MLCRPEPKESSHAKDEGGRRFRACGAGPGNCCVLERAGGGRQGDSDELDFTPINVGGVNIDNHDHHGSVNSASLFRPFGHYTK